MMTRHLSIVLILVVAVCVGCARPSSQAKRLRQLALNGSKADIQSELKHLFDVGSPASAYADLLSHADGVWTNKEDQEITHIFGDIEGQEGDHLAVVLINTASNTIKDVFADVLMQ
jgi:hypothetical protein